MAIAKVQEVSSYTASGGSTGKTLTISTPGAGNTLAIWGGNIDGASISSISGGGVTWTRQATFNGIELWTGPNSSGSGTTITVTVSNTYARFNVNFTEWSGMPSTLTADGGSNASTSNPSNTTPSVTPTGSPVLLLAGIITSTAGWSAGPTGGFTNLPVTGGSARIKFAYQIAGPASGSYQAGWTNVVSYGSTNAGLYGFDGTSSTSGQPAMRRFGGIENANFRCGSEGVKMWRVQPRPNGLLVPDRSLVIPQPEMRIAN